MKKIMSIFRKCVNRNHHSIYWHTVMFINGFDSSKQQPNKLEDRPNPHLIKCDYVGPPDRLSNLRPYVRYIPKTESTLARTYRLKLIEVEAWNQDFWSKHNKNFYEEKKDFIKQLQTSRNEDKITDDEMSVFYKRFLDKNREMHIRYNMTWYMKNFQLLLLAARVALQRLFTKEKLNIKILATTKKI